MSECTPLLKGAAPAAAYNARDTAGGAASTGEAAHQTSSTLLAAYPASDSRDLMWRPTSSTSQSTAGNGGARARAGAGAGAGVGAGDGSGGLAGLLASDRDDAVHHCSEGAPSVSLMRSLEGAPRSAAARNVGLGRPVQVDPMKPTLKAPGINRLKL